MPSLSYVLYKRISGHNCVVSLTGFQLDVSELWIEKDRWGSFLGDEVMNIVDARASLPTMHRRSSRPLEPEL